MGEIRILPQCRRNRFSASWRRAFRDPADDAALVEEVVDASEQFEILVDPVIGGEFPFRDVGDFVAVRAAGINTVSASGEGCGGVFELGVGPCGAGVNRQAEGFAEWLGDVVLHQAFVQRGAVDLVELVPAALEAVEIDGAFEAEEVAGLGDPFQAGAPVFGLEGVELGGGVATVRIGFNIAVAGIGLCAGLD
jgi:hypothetical protein